MPSPDLASLKAALDKLGFDWEAKDFLYAWNLEAGGRLALVLNAAPALIDEIERLQAKWRREECARCDVSPGGHQGTIYCEECFRWYKDQHAKQEITELRECRDILSRLLRVEPDTKEEFELIKRGSQLTGSESWVDEAEETK